MDSITREIVVKILGGKLKGRNFYMPAAIRPTQNLVRKALFDIYGHDLKDQVVLEVFAGSGAIGLEAISLGAKFVTFVDHNEKSCRVIRDNVALLNIENYELLERDAFASMKMLYREGRKFDLIFLDPPYGLDLAKKALKTLGGYDILQPNCQVIIQHDKREILPHESGRILRFKEKVYGSSVLSFYSANTSVT